MTQPDGIDMSRSGWTNPEGFQRAPRPAVHVKPVAACEAPGPDGWVCDLPPGHGGEEHRADDGTPEGFRWVQRYANVSTIADKDSVLIPSVREVVKDGGRVERIEAIAEGALASQSPAAWAVALDKIVEVCRGE